MPNAFTCTHLCCHPSPLPAHVLCMCAGAGGADGRHHRPARLPGPLLPGPEGAALYGRAWGGRLGCGLYVEVSCRKACMQSEHVLLTSSPPHLLILYSSLPSLLAASRCRTAPSLARSASTTRWRACCCGTPRRSSTWCAARLGTCVAQWQRQAGYGSRAGKAQRMTRAAALLLAPWPTGRSVRVLCPSSLVFWAFAAQPVPLHICRSRTRRPATARTRWRTSSAAPSRRASRWVLRQQGAQWICRLLQSCGAGHGHACRVLVPHEPLCL